MRRVPLLSGSRVVVVPVDDEDVIIRPPPPARAVDTTAAVRDALRFPLEGPPLGALATRGGRATIVVEPPALPLPGASHDPRQDALAAAIAELEQCGVPYERQTIVVAGGLGRRLGRRDLERLLPPPEARSFRGRVLVHDVEDPQLVDIVDGVRVNPALASADVVVVVTAAETVLHGGPAALVACCDGATVRAATAGRSLLEAAGSNGWSRGLEVEAAVGQLSPLIGISLVLDLPRLTGSLSGYPHDVFAADRIAHSPLRGAFSRLPAFVRRDILATRGRRLAATTAFAGRPSVAHAEALVRGVELRGARLEEPLDALIVGAPWISHHLPREPVNPVTTAAVALGLALRLHRGQFPVEPDGTVVLCHPLTRAFVHGTQAPYAAMFNALHTADDPAVLAAAELGAASDDKALSAYRAGKACHPLLPYADWAGCASVLDRVGRVVVAGSRDATAARALGFVPSHSVASALEMAHGVADGRARVGVLLA
ncbi:MAG: lactate racemase domain-containing protein, partial [Gaiellaceae bacterium]